MRQNLLFFEKICPKPKYQLISNRPITIKNIKHYIIFQGIIFFFVGTLAAPRADHGPPPPPPSQYAAAQYAAPQYAAPQCQVQRFEQAINYKCQVILLFIFFLEL